MTIEKSKCPEYCGCKGECDCHIFVGGSGKPCPECDSKTDQFDTFITKLKEEIGLYDTERIKVIEKLAQEYKLQSQESTGDDTLQKGERHLYSSGVSCKPETLPDNIQTNCPLGETIPDFQEAKQGCWMITDCNCHCGEYCEHCNKIELCPECQAKTVTLTYTDEEQFKKCQPKAKEIRIESIISIITLSLF